MTKPSVTELSPADYIEIHQLYAKYSFALDLGDGDGRAATFTADGTFKAALTNHKPDNVQTLRERTRLLGNQGRRHLMMNIVITPTPEGAAGRAYAVILGPAGQEADDRSLEGKSGFYIDTLVKTAQGWRFRTREFWRDTDADSPFKRGAPPPPMPWQ
jgi:hypothetical protein